MSLLEKKTLSEIRDLVKTKVGLVDPQFVYNDLFPLVESKVFLSQFLQDFNKVIASQLDYVLS